jgi:ubiquitin-like-conjugating enzyme ATG3
MSNIKNTIFETYKKVAENVVPDLKESKFYEKGYLTYQEFIDSGDHLVHKCPTWQWQSGQ